MAPSNHPGIPIMGTQVKHVKSTVILTMCYMWNIMLKSVLY